MSTSYNMKARSIGSSSPLLSFGNECIKPWISCTNNKKSKIALY